MKTVLFACVHNAGRSQMAAAFFTLLADPAKARAISAGTQPAGAVHPEVIATMREIGVDLSAARSTLLTDAVAREAQLFVGMGCGEACPFVPGLERVEWAVEDPKGRSPEDVRRIRGELRARVAALVHQRGWARATP